MDQAWAQPRRADDVLPRAADGAESGKLADARGRGRHRHQLGRPRAHFLKAPGGRAHVPLVDHLLSGGSKQRATEDDGGEQDALRRLGRNREDDLPDAEIVLGDEELALARRDPERIVTRQAADVVGPESRCVHDRLRRDGHIRARSEGDLALAEDDAGDRLPEKDLGAVHHGALAVGPRRPERIDHALTLDQEGSARSVGDGGDKFGDLLVGEALNRDAVTAGLRHDVVAQARLLVLVGRHHDGPGLQVGYVEVGDYVRPDIPRLPEQSSLETAGRGIEPGVDDRAVRFAGAFADVRMALDHSQAGIERRQLARDRATHDTGSDHDQIERARRRCDHAMLSFTRGLANERPDGLRPRRWSQQHRQRGRLPDAT